MFQPSFRKCWNIERHNPTWQQGSKILSPSHAIEQLDLCTIVAAHSQPFGKLIWKDQSFCQENDLPMMGFPYLRGCTEGYKRGWELIGSQGRFPGIGKRVFPLPFRLPDRAVNCKNTYWILDQFDRFISILPAILQTFIGYQLVAQTETKSIKRRNNWLDMWMIFSIHRIILSYTWSTTSPFEIGFALASRNCLSMNMNDIIR